MVLLGNLVFNFQSGISITTTFLIVNVYLMQNMKKKPIEIPVSLFFFTTSELIWPKFGPKDHTHFAFFVWFPMKYVRGTININNLCCNPVVPEKLVKLKNCFLDPICTEKGSLWATPKREKNSFGRTNKSRSSAFRKFLFYQNIICFALVMDLFLSWVMFSVKKVSFPAKTVVGKGVFKLTISKL